jgi:5-methylcytosine-specific restriction protein A
MESDISALALYVPNLPEGTLTSDRLTLEHCWQEAEEVFSSAQSVPLQMMVLLGEKEGEEHCVAASAVVTAIQLEKERTHIHFKDLLPIAARPLAPCLLDEEEELLEAGSLNEARLVTTPSFVLEVPKTFLLTWNPLNEVPMAEFEEARRQLASGEPCSWHWTCRSNRKVRAGDHFLMLRKGDKPRGIVGSGWIRTNAWYDAQDVSYVDILWRRLVDPNRPLDTATIQGADQVHWSPQGSGIELPEDAFEAVWQAWDAYSANDRAAERPPTVRPAEARLPLTPAAQTETESAEDAASSVEGRLIEGWSTHRERDPVNRARCLAAHGYRCAVCAMSFAEEYGEIGEGFIHIHHENPLAASDDAAGAVHDPETTMKPVCPNCHAMLHRGQDATRGEVRSIAELKALRAEAQEMKNTFNGGR